MNRSHVKADVLYIPLLAQYKRKFKKTIVLLLKNKIENAEYK